MDDHSLQSQTPDPDISSENTPQKNKKATISFGVIILSVILIVVLLISCFQNNSPKGVAKSYIKACYNCDSKKVYSLVLGSGLDRYKNLAEKEDKYLDEYFLEITDNRADNYNDFCKLQNEKAKKEYKKKYGDNLKIEFKSVEEKELSNEELTKIKDKYKKHDYIKSDKISAACEVTVQFKITGSDESKNFREKFTAVKYRGKWKLLS